MMYSAAFDVSKITPGTITLATAGESNAVVDLSAMTTTGFGGSSTSVMMHAIDNSMTCTAEDGSGSTALGHVGAANFATVLQSAMQSEAFDAGWAAFADIFVNWSSTTGLFTYTFDATTSMTFSAAAGRALCGVSADRSGAAFYQGDVVPTYVIIPTLTAVSDPSNNYEPANIANHVRSDAGGGYGISRQVAPLCRDWLQQFEVKAKTKAASAASTHPFTFEHLFKHCRGIYPFMVVDGFGEAYHEMFSLRTEGMPWHPEYGSPLDATSYHIPFRCWVEGQIG